MVAQHIKCVEHMSMLLCHLHDFVGQFHAQHYIGVSCVAQHKLGDAHRLDHDAAVQLCWLLVVVVLLCTDAKNMEQNVLEEVHWGAGRVRMHTHRRELRHLGNQHPRCYHFRPPRAAHSRLPMSV